MNKSALKISIFAIVACILWSTAFPAVKIGLAYCKPLPFAGIRFLLSGSILFLFVILMKNKKSIPLSLSFPQSKTVFWVSIFQTVILYALYFIGMTYVSSAIGAIIIGSAPLITALTTHVITDDDKITRAKLACIITGIIGIAIITLNKSPLGEGSYFQIFGIFILILSSISSAIGNIIVSKNKQTINPIVLTAYQMFFGGLILLVISILFQGIPLLIKEPKFYIALLWLAFISAIAFSIWFWLLQKPEVQVSELNIWKFIIPVFGVVLSWLLIPEEHPSLIIIIGMIIAAFSVLLYNIPGKKGR
jgi:drug/metabolite transporter (DMT)-like permease